MRHTWLDKHVASQVTKLYNAVNVTAVPILLVYPSLELQYAD